MSKQPMTRQVLESRVQVNPDTGCWIYMGVSGKGIKDVYPTTKLNGVNILMHRLAYILYVAAIPEGMDIRHTCDTPHCCNPTHLRPGTHEDNMQDKVASGHQHRPVGETNVKAKLTEQQVRAIRADPRSNGQEIADEYRVTRTNIWDIRRGNTWKHLKDAA